MSKSSKKKVKEFRRSEKAKRRAANRARYAALAGSEANKKVRRSTKLARGAAHQHESGDCGNVACRRCSIRSAANDPMLATPGSYLYGLRFRSSKYSARRREIHKLVARVHELQQVRSGFGANSLRHLETQAGVEPGTFDRVAFAC